MTEQLELPCPERRYSIVECRDTKGNCWRHRVSDPEETVRMIESLWGDVKAIVRER